MPPEDYEKRKLKEMSERVKYYSKVLKELENVRMVILQRELAKNMKEYAEKYPN